MVIDVETQNIGKAILVTLSGELDLSVCAQVENELKSIEQQAPELLLLDLRALRFMDSTGLRLILATDQRARARGSRMAIVPGPHTVQRLFEITRLDTRLEFVDASATQN